MNTNILQTAVALPDGDLLSRIAALAGTERETTAELVAHLAALELRPSLYAALGYGTLFDYCTQALRLSEDAACTRISAARTCRSFPMVLDLLSSGAVSLTTLRLLKPHLTAENHQVVLARATHKRCEEIKALVAELAPQPDVPSSVRKLPSEPTPDPGSGPALIFEERTTSTAVVEVSPDGASPIGPHSGCPAGSTPTNGLLRADMPPIRRAVAAGPRPAVQPLAPERYRVQFTIGQDTHDKLRRLQALMRREIPTGDVAAIFDQAVDLMLEKVERAKLGAKAPGSRRPATRKGSATYENRIRFKTDESGGQEARVASTGATSPASRVAASAASTDPASAASTDPASAASTDPASTASTEAVSATSTSAASAASTDVIRRLKPTRHVPNRVKRAVWWRDRAQCAFVSAAGHRCTQRALLEIHHIQPHALDGPPTVGNLSLRCRRHNAYEAELVFGTRPGGGVRGEA
jgi:hypothetical protein